MKTAQEASFPFMILILQEAQNQ